MKPSLKTLLVVLVIASGFVAGSSLPVNANAAPEKAAPESPKTKDKKSAPAAKAPPAGVAVNACGCYRSDSGACYCGDKKGKCECPGDCEPLGCDEKRAKEVEREVAAETKKAQEQEKKRQALEAAQEAKENAPTPDPGEAGSEAPGDKGDQGEKSESRKPGRKARKDSASKTR